MNGKGISRIAVLSMSLLFLNLLIAISVFGNGGIEKMHTAFSLLQ